MVRPTLVLLLLLLVGQHMDPMAAPAKVVQADYPVHVRVLTAKGRERLGNFVGYGHGDILGARPQGFNYSFECGGALATTDAPEDFYQAKWIKQDLVLELLTQTPGKSHAGKCELKVAMTPTPFGKYPAEK